MFYFLQIFLIQHFFLQESIFLQNCRYSNVKWLHLSFLHFLTYAIQSLVNPILQGFKYIHIKFTILSFFFLPLHPQIKIRFCNIFYGEYKKHCYYSPR